MKKNRKTKGTFGQNWRSAKTRKKSLENLINQIPSELERFQKQALLLDDHEAAKELLRRATEVQQYLGPVLMDAPHLLSEEAVKRLEMPALVALSRGHRYYYKRVLNQLRELKLGSETGIACHERANWKSEGMTGAWAVGLYNTVEALRTKSTPEGDHVIEAFVRWIRMDHPTIAEDALTLEPFGRRTVEEWIKKVCSPVLYVFRPELRPAKRGKRKRTDKERADPHAKRQRDAILQRIREMAAGPDKGHSWVKRPN
jgi:hypothetical protein